MKRLLFLILIAALLCLAAGCRTRTTVEIPDAPATELTEPEGEQVLPEPEPEAPATVEPEPEPDTPSEEDPDSDRKEYDGEAEATVQSDADHIIETGTGVAEAPASAPASDQTAAVQDSQAVQSVTETVPAEEADQAGVSDTAPMAGSPLFYYLALLQDRLGSLFECKRMNVYWETAKDYETIYKTSQEHALIDMAGAYDVSAKLLPENLAVDDGWVQRKNPDVIIKTVERSVLGSGVSGTAAAKSVFDSMTARNGWNQISAVKGHQVILVSEELLESPVKCLAAAIYFAKEIYPEQFADIDADEALRQLTTGGSQPLHGTFFYAE